jgi:anti-sigma regulatory factor (Ser/Thr protein kinase)
VSPVSSGNELDLPDALVKVSEPNQVGEARRSAVSMANRLGFDETKSGKVALIVSESASNIVKHGRGGDLIVRVVREGGRTGLEIFALDRGPGMADPDRCFQDGYSTAGTMGTGLGAIRRQADFFEMHTRKDNGTALVARVWMQQAAVGAESVGTLEIGALCVAKSGEIVVGDGWALEEINGRVYALMADGLGHGELAANASRTAVRILRNHSSADPVTLVTAIHDGLRSTRGAAIALAAIDFEARLVRYVGVGNISGAVVTASESRRMVSHNGTAGAEARKIQEFVYAFPPRAQLIMHTDGIGTHWALEAYPGLLQRSPALIAGVLFRDFTRGRDDATILVLREPIREQT